ncbi:hypothetical protein RT95_10725 [Xanthomonas campestris]|nr:hypothetical protein RT95_10725 [Xanthomonas campestris]
MQAVRNGDGRYSNALYLQVVDDALSYRSASASLGGGIRQLMQCTAHHAFCRALCGHPHVA